MQFGINFIQNKLKDFQKDIKKNFVFGGVICMETVALPGIAVILLR